MEVFGIDDQTWTKLVWGGVIFCVVAPLIFVIVRFLYRIRKPPKDSIESVVREMKHKEGLGEAQAEFEKRKREREEQMKKFEERHKK